MVLKEGDKVILRDVHSKYDGETGTINGIMETMFGSSNYNIKFDGIDGGFYFKNNVIERNLDIVQISKGKTLKIN